MDRPAVYAAELICVGAAYYVLAKVGLQLASINPSATPIWPPTGLALGAVLLRGARVAPAIFVAAFVANVTTAGSIYTSLAIAMGNTLEAVVGAQLIRLWSQRRGTFDSAIAVARFALISPVAAAISATIGVISLSVAGFADWSKFGSIWITWWLGDLAGALVIAPVIVLWGTTRAKSFRPDELAESAVLFVATAGVGLIGFSPLVEETAGRAPLGFLAVLPLLWAALRRGQRDTATVALILSVFAVWGTMAGGGPFAQPSLNDSILVVIMFMISTAVPSLALSADVAMRRRTEQNLRAIRDELDQRVQLRTAALEKANIALEREVEQRKRAEAEITQQSVHLREAQRIANLGSWAWDIPQDKVSWSEQMFDIFGIRSEDFGGTFNDFLALVHADDRPRVTEQSQQALASGHGFGIEERIVRPDGQIRVLQSSSELIKDAAGKPLRLLGICQDVTERRKAEGVLRETQERYRILIDNLRDYAIFMLDPSGLVVSWNSGAQRIKGYSASEIIGRHYRAFFTEEDRRQREPERALEMAAKEGKYETEGLRIRRDGTGFWASAVINAIRDDNGALVGFAKVTRDITERHEAQTALEQAREQMAQSQKMEALGQLTGGIAHDFNNLLMIVSGQSEILRKRLSEPKDMRSLDAIQTATARGAKLTRQLLTFGRQQNLTPTVVDPRERIDAVREMLASSLRGNIELAVDIPADIWPVAVDVAELELALVNIAVNARDAMPNGGTITLSARNVTLKPGMQAAALDGDFVALKIIDSGVGIPPEIMSRVFEPFFSTKAVGKGTGLGLSQVYGFASQSGGTVTVASEVGKGTTVTIYLPRSHAPVVTIAQAQAAQDKAPPLPRGEGTVLMVEDNPDVAHVTSSLLEQLGYRVLHADNAGEALKRLQGDEKINLVFSDIVMPGSMNGIALAQEIRDLYPRLPILLTSGFSDMVQAARSEFAILPKPFQVAALERALHDAIARHRAADGGAERPAAGVSKGRKA